MVTRLILDMDPGIDDAMALITALNTPEVQVLGVSVVAGNLPLDTVADNAAALLEIMKSPARVYKGSAGPLYGLAKPVPDIHGEGGLGRWHLEPCPEKIDPQHAVSFIADTASAHPGEVTLVATGPLTNVALLVDRHPREAAMLKELVIMGGAVSAPGNITPVAEFNIHSDPEAAQLVFISGLRVTMVGLDVTHQVQVYPHDLPRLGGLGSLGPGVVRMLEHYFHWAGPGRGCPLHDPLAVMAATRPECFGFNQLPVWVETRGICRGQTVADFNGRMGWPAKLRVALSVDIDACLNWFETALIRS